MAVKTKHTGAVRKRRKQQSGSLEDETDTDRGRRQVKRLPKIKGGEVFEVTVLANRKAKAPPKKGTRPRRHRKIAGGKRARHKLPIPLTYSAGPAVWQRRRRYVISGAVAALMTVAKAKSAEKDKHT